MYSNGDSYRELRPRSRHSSWTKVNNVHIRWVCLRNVHAAFTTGPHHVGYSDASVRVVRRRQASHWASFAGLMSNGPTFVLDPWKQVCPCSLRQPPAPASGPAALVRFALIVFTAAPSSVRTSSPAAIEAHHRDPPRRAVQHPRPVAPRHEDVARRLDPLQHPPVGPAPDRLRRQQPRPLYLPVGDQRPRPLEPVRTPGRRFTCGTRPSYSARNSRST